ncbi:DUF1569 domain-containing protein [Roseimaritima sediminicola]|uniref:DUF1569 domain-containing protein n=1 Tax=Roseimaritima sediminicola TaxID=2662066 RepID=UPI00129840DE|nr:DUF1569 domain-containing protein [Roseimaritima sediminicola]
MVRKRALDFRSGDAVIAEIEQLRTDGYVKTKRWNLTQICEHLDATMRGGMEGFGFRAPRLLRATVLKWSLHHMLKTRRMRSVPTLPRLKPRPASAVADDDDVVIDHCIATIRRAAAFAGPIEDYPFLDDLDVEDWRQFMWLHAAHHLAFLIPMAAVHSDTEKIALASPSP